MSALETMMVNLFPVLMLLGLISPFAALLSAVLFMLAIVVVLNHGVVSQPLRIPWL
jgi:uncharacterized membrane protein YphA (DoxX/SURF4 family)